MASSALGPRRSSGDLRADRLSRRVETREKDMITSKTPVAQPPRVKSCLECMASKTPIWRSGPRGHKTLCNACGIRYKRRKKKMELSGIDPDTDGSPADDVLLIKLSAEEMKQNQREKQLWVLRAMMQQQQQWKRRRVGRRRARRAAKRPPSPSPSPSPSPPASGAGDSERDEAEQAALLLLSLSSGVLH